MSQNPSVSFAWSTLGHETVKKYCEHTLKNGKINHATLFCGPQGIGKNRLVDDFIQMLLCKGYHEQQGVRFPTLPCGHCAACRFSRVNTHPEVISLTPIDGAPTISVEQARAAKIRLSLKAQYGNKKVLIINPADRLTVAAANALLKLLEEPTPHTHLFLIATDLQAVLPTIRSRVSLLRLRPLLNHQITSFLKEQKIPTSLSQTLLKWSQGRIGKVMEWLAQPDLHEQHQSWANAIIPLLGNFSATHWKQLPDLLPSKERARAENDQLLLTWFTLFRDLLILRYHVQLPLTHEQHRTQLERIAQILSKEQLLHAFDALSGLTEPNALSQQTRLTFENILFSFISTSSYA